MGAYRKKKFILIVFGQQTEFKRQKKKKKEKTESKEKWERETILRKLHEQRETEKHESGRYVFMMFKLVFALSPNSRQITKTLKDFLTVILRGKRQHCTRL